MAQFPDHVVRKEAFAWLEATRIAAGRTAEESLVLPRTALAKGFDIQGERVPLVAPNGIFIPRASASDLPLTITTAPNGPYDDGFLDDNTLSYRYRGEDPNHRENRGLREIMRLRIPLIYLHGFEPGQYVVTWPVFIVGDNPEQLRFIVRAEDRHVADFWASQGEIPEDFSTGYGELRRQHKTREVKVRLHQQAFRARVLKAYKNRCALCRLHHPPLLDAAHITPDHEDLGEPLVSNGLSLCKIHHAAFDKYYLGIRPDYTVHIRQDLLEEFDGPMLQHALKEMHNKSIGIPSRSGLRPDPVRLEKRYAAFLSM